MKYNIFWLAVCTFMILYPVIRGHLLRSTHRKMRYKALKHN